MKSNQEMFSAKLEELDQQYEKIRDKLRICQREDPAEILQELEKAREEFKKKSVFLQRSVKNSRSKAVSALAAAQLNYKEKTEKLLRDEIAGFLHSADSSPGEDKAGAAPLFTECAIDFASLAVDYALLVSMSAIASEKQ